MKVFRPLNREYVYVSDGTGYYRVPSEELAMMKRGYKPLGIVKVTEREFCDAMRAALLDHGLRLARGRGVVA